jgi:RND family efflux transporter MFP subunit
MTGREKRLVGVGALVGLLLAGLVYGAYTLKQKPQTGKTSQTAVGEPQKPLAAASDMAGMKMDSPSDSASTANVDLTPDEEKSLGLQAVEVKKRTIKRELRSVGKVAEAENQQSTISARIGGRLDKLLVRFTGENVSKGQAVASIYSPEIVSSAEEYRLALENLEKLGRTASPDAIEPAKELVAASKRRLELWGLSQEQIREIEKGDAKVHLAIFATAGGTVTDRKVTEGQYVKEGDVLYVLSDLSRVWVLAEVYESDLPSIRIGEMAGLEIEGSTRKLQGRVNFIDPMVNQQTRTIPIRIEVANYGMQLRPGMFVQVLFKGSPQADVLSVPRTAVVDTGMHKIVYVAKGNGSYESRAIEIGPAGEDFYPVLSGLKPGERVVTQGAFLVDSQTRLTSGSSGQFGGSKEYSRDSGAQNTAPESGYQITFKSDPSELKGGSLATFRASLTDASGKAVSDAQVSVRLFMPAMPSMGMGAMDQSAPLAFNGSEYSGAVTVPMAGPWNVTVEAQRNGQRIAIKQSRMSAK